MRALLEEGLAAISMEPGPRHGVLAALGAAAAGLAALGTATDYRMQHTAPDARDAPLHDLTANKVYPADIYERPDWYLPGHASDWDAWSKIRRAHGRPSVRVWMYRAVPKGVRAINTGDWVSLTRAYARDHSRADDSANDMAVITASAQADQLFTDGNSFQEWGYVGPPVKGQVVVRPRRKKKVA